MPDIFYPLLTGGGSDPNSGANVVPDWANDKIYTWGPTVGTSHTLWTSKASDGTFLAANTVVSVCGISANTFIVGSAIVLGTDGTHIYAMTSHGTTGTQKQNNLRLSKIDTATMMEVAAYIPYAITNKIAEGYFISGAGDWRLSAFKLAGVDYLALLLNGSDPANIEIIGTAALTSVVTYNYTTQGGADVHMVVGEQPTGSTQKLYLMQDEPNGDATQIGFIATTFNNAPSIADVLVRNVLASDIDATWTGTFPDVEVRCLDLMFCSTDASLLFAVLDDISSGPNLPPLTKVVKIDTTVATVGWTVTVSNDIFNLANTQFSQAAALADLSGTSLIFCDPNSNTYYTITIATGAFTTATSSHFDGTISDNGVRYPAVWDSVRSRLIYYYEGSNDLSPGWPTGGWAVWGPGSTPPIPTPGDGESSIQFKGEAGPSISLAALGGQSQIQFHGQASISLPIEHIALFGRSQIIFHGFLGPVAPAPAPGSAPDFDWQVTVISQYSNSPILLRLLENFFLYVDPTTDLDSFYNLIWNVDTARGYGLDVWGRIVGVSRILEIATPGPFFGFEEAGDAVPFGFGPFWSGIGSSSSYRLSDTGYRTLIFAKALANISDGSIPAINQLLINLFGSGLSVGGNAYVEDHNNMTMVYKFTFSPTPVQLAIIEQSGVLPKPTGVSVTVSVPP